MKRPQKLWLVKYILRGKRHQETSPLCSYKWQAAIHLKQRHPTAEIVSIESYRTMAVKK